MDANALPLYSSPNEKRLSHIPKIGSRIVRGLICRIACCSLVIPSVFAAKLPGQTVTTRVDSARHEVVIEAGPFDIPAEDPEMLMEMKMGQMAMHHDEEVQVFRFDWPVDGMGRGFRLELHDKTGGPLPTALLHHLIAINFDRRQFAYAATERLFGAGREAHEAALPGTLAVPLDLGQRLGFYVAWHNETGHDVTGATLRIVMNWVPRKAAARYTAVMPVYLDVNNDVGGDNTFDIPPGKSSKSFEFQAPVGGSLIAISGHLHDYGAALRLEDAETDKVLVRLEGKRDADGKILGVAQKFFLFRPIRLRDGHRYRVVAEYDSPLDHTLEKGAMGNIDGVFAPDSPSRWPAIDPNDPTFRKDIESLRVVVPSTDANGGKKIRTEVFNYGERASNRIF